MLLYLIFQFVIFLVTYALKFDDMTYDIFPINSGLIAAFGHFNSDGYTDVFSLQQGGNKLKIFLSSETGQQFQSYINCTFESIITSVVPGDFNGDSVMDVLITLINGTDSSERDVRILWGTNGNIECKSPIIFTVVNQPLVVDFNGDMIPDIIAETRTGERYVWFSSKQKLFINKLLSSNQKFGNPHSSGLIDMNDDLAADILIMGEYYIEVGIYSGGKFKFSNESIIHYPNTSSDHIKLQSTFVDLNLDAKLDVIMPVCHDSNCDSSAIYLLNKTSFKWELLFDSFKYNNVTWGFKLPKGSPLDMAALPVTLRAGDIDMDGYPDFLTILETKSPKESKSRAVILKNIPCNSHCVSDRCLEVIWDIPGLKDVPNIEIAAFFDIFENGILDILASSKDNEWKIHALVHSGNQDSCFMKVLVLNGLCDKCKELKDMPRGVNQPGPIVQYNMTTQDGHHKVSKTVQISQTAYFPLHLPYSVFGLGETPNFVDALTVAIPSNKSVHKREWTQIIPNSQIVVIPHPPQDEGRWIKKLFVTPSQYVLLTGISLIGTCAFIAIIVGILHWREKKEDKKEKMQDAYRFHFDAM